MDVLWRQPLVGIEGWRHNSRALDGRFHQFRARPEGRQPDSETLHLEHEIAGHLNDVRAPVELLQVVGEEIGLGEGIAINFDQALRRAAGAERVAPADRPAGMLGADAPALQPGLQAGGIESLARRYAIDDDETVDVELDLDNQRVA